MTITHQTTDDLKDRLREKLTRLVNPEPQIEEAIVIDGEKIDVDKELGLDDDLISPKSLRIWSSLQKRYNICWIIWTTLP